MEDDTVNTTTGATTRSKTSIAQAAVCEPSRREATEHTCDCTKKIDLILDKLQKLDVIEKLQEKVNKIEQDVDHLKSYLYVTDQNVASKASCESVLKLTKTVEDLGNRLRRNNLVFYGIMEGAEDEYNSMQQFITDFLETHMEMANAAEIEIERAHRTPSRPTGRGTRPIHVALLRYTDKQRILRAARKTLKNNPFNGRNIYIAEDFCPSVNYQRKVLAYYKKKIIQENPQSRAYILYPAKLKVVQGNSTRIYGDSPDIDGTEPIELLIEKYGRSPYSGNK